MGSLFSKPKQKPKSTKSDSTQVSEKDRAILNLKNVRDKLRRYQGKLENDSKKLEAQVKELIALRLKNRALLVLKLKRFKEKELDKIESKLMTIQTQINDVEWASINVSILNAIEAGTKELNRIHEERSVEDVQLLIDESNEAIEVENRINMVLAGQLTASDELELESELETIMNSFSVPVTNGKKEVVSTKLIGKKLSEEVPIPDIVLPLAPVTPILPAVVNNERKSEGVAKLAIPS